jgi:hypothetical protein
MPPGFEAAFSRRRIVLDGVAQERSDWGAVAVVYATADSILYLNVAVADNWFIRNAPLFPSTEAATLETLVYFDLATIAQVEVGELNVAISAGSFLSTAPAVFRPVPLTQEVELYWTNFVNQPFAPLAPPPSGHQGGAFPGLVFCRKDYPNQPCGKNECGPTAVSNSLQWLNREYNLGIDPKKLTIDHWKGPLGWDPTGGVTHGEWANLKKAYVDKKANGLPIDSSKVGGGHVALVQKEFDGTGPTRRAQAVEVDMGSHVGSVTCIGGPDNKGNYTMNVASDTKQQGQAGPGNPQVQQVVITPNGEVVSGPPWAQGEKVQNFVVQCPHPGKFKAS